MIVSINISDLKNPIIAAGSGTILTRDGAILTSYHVIYDPRHHRPRDLFLVGMLSSAGEIAFACAGKPKSAETNPDQDLALIRCNQQHLRSSTPKNWPMARWRSEKLSTNEIIWIAGYRAGDPRQTLSRGKVLDWTQDPYPLAKTDSPIWPGMSGGAAFDENGHLVGVLQGFRRLHVPHYLTIGKIGLITPFDANHWFPPNNPQFPNKKR